MFLPAPFLWKPLDELSESVRTGTPAFNRLFGQDFFAYIGSRPEEAAAFNRLMTQEILWTTPALLRAYDFSRFKCLVDIRGGLGLSLNHILAATPTLGGILFDQPKVVDDAKASFKDDVAARVKIVGGNFFESVPKGGDAYILKRIIHDWVDEDAIKILGNVRRSMPTCGTLLLVESLVDSRTQPAGLMDLLMLILGGRERTEAEFRSLPQSAGLLLSRVISVGSYSLLESHPV